MSENFYYDDLGNTVFRSSYYKKRGSCCKSACLHCPYGYTLREKGLTKEVINEKSLKVSKSIFDFHHNKKSEVQSLLDSAFGTKKKEFTQDEFYLLRLKNIPCGILNKANPNEYFLHWEFMDQGIDIGHISLIKENPAPQ